MQLSLFGPATTPAPLTQQAQPVAQQAPALTQQAPVLPDYRADDFIATREAILAAARAKTEEAHQRAQDRPLRQKVEAWLKVLAAAARLRRATTQRFDAGLLATGEQGAAQSREAWFLAWRQERQYAEEYTRLLLEQSPAKLLTLPELTRQTFEQIERAYPQANLCADVERIYFNPFEAPIFAQAHSVRVHLLDQWLDAEADPAARLAGYDLVRGRLALSAWGADFDDECHSTELGLHREGDLQLLPWRLPAAALPPTP